jgi:beta-glucanase (GH16 family)
MKRLLAFLLAASSVQAQAQEPTPVIPNGSVGSWKLALNENFEGAGLDSKVWNYNLWFPGAINQEQQYYRAENVKVANGKLVITAQKETVTTGWDGSAPNRPTTLPYTSGLIQTRAKFEQAYGVYEARLKLPKGKGFFPAFWLKSNPIPGGRNAPPEIDIMENLGHEPRIYHTYHHILDGKNTHSPGNWMGEDFSTDFHTFTVEWTPEHIRWFVDGVERRKAFTNVAAIWDKPMFVLLNLAIGSGWSGLPSENTRFPQTLEADYVRVWQITPAALAAAQLAAQTTAKAAAPLSATEPPWIESLPLTNLKAPRPILVDGKPFIPNGIYMGGEKCRDNNGNSGKIIKGACISGTDVPAMWDLDRIAAAGFNTVLSYTNGAKDNVKDWSEYVSSVRTFLDRANERNIKVIFSLKNLYFNKTNDWALSDANLQKTLTLFKTQPNSPADPTPRDVARSLVREFKEHPALLAWNINDELSTEYISELQAMYDTIKAEDSVNPVMQLLFRLHDPSPLTDPRKYVSSTDILAADPYPIGLGRPYTIETVSDWTRKLVAAADGKKGVWMVAQAFARNFDPPPNMSEIAPTPAEMRNMSYQMLINGANGVLFWSLAALQIEPAPLYNADGTVARHETEVAVNHRGQVTKDAYGRTVKRVLYEPLKNPDGTVKTLPNGRPVYPPNFGRRWPEMKVVAAEMNAVVPAVADGQEITLPEVTLAAKVQRRALKYNGSLYVMAINTDVEKAAKLSWQLPPANGAGQRSVDGGSTLTARLAADKRTLTLTIPPLGSGFVKISGF